MKRKENIKILIVVQSLLDLEGNCAILSSRGLGENVADLFTKPLPAEPFNRFCESLVVPII